MVIRVRVFTALGLVGSLLSSTVIADGLESILVTANAPVDQSVGYLDSLDIITREQISLQQPVDTNQLLDGIEGVYASREGGPGGVNSLTVRGAEPNFAVVLIDGVAVNDPTNTRGGSFDLATMSAIAVRRVELIKGPRSVVYGSDALAGVVKLITAPTEGESSGLQLYQESQEHGAFRQAGEAVLANTRHAVSLQASREDSGRVWQGSLRTLEEKAVHYRADFDHSTLQLGGRQAEFDKRAYPEQSGGPRFSTSAERDISIGDDQTAYISSEISPMTSWRVAAQYSEFDRFLDYYSPGIAPYNNVPENFYTADYSRQQWRLVSELRLGGINLNVGIDRRWESGVSEGQVVFTSIPVDALGFLLGLPSPPVETGLGLPVELALDTDYSLRRTTQGRFAELNWQSDGDWVLSAGIRRDTGDEAHETVRRYRVSVPAGLTRINFSYSEGFKLPSFFALGHGLVGNPELKPEQVKSYDIEWLAQWYAVGLELSVFHTQYHDLIDFDAEAFTNVNRNRVTSRGGEISLNYRWHRWQLRGSWSHVAIDVERSDRRLANRPENTAVLELNWQPADYLSWHNRVRWVDEQFATSLYTGESREYVLDDYTLWDSALRWQLNNMLAITAGLENVANTRYQEAVGFPGHSRLLRVGLLFTL